MNVYILNEDTNELSIKLSFELGSFPLPISSIIDESFESVEIMYLSNSSIIDTSLLSFIKYDKTTKNVYFKSNKKSNNKLHGVKLDNKYNDGDKLLIKKSEYVTFDIYSDFLISSKYIDQVKLTELEKMPDIFTKSPTTYDDIVHLNFLKKSDEFIFDLSLLNELIIYDSLKSKLYVLNIPLGTPFSNFGLSNIKLLKYKNFLDILNNDKTGIITINIDNVIKSPEPVSTGYVVSNIMVLCDNFDIDWLVNYYGKECKTLFNFDVLKYSIEV